MKTGKAEVDDGRWTPASRHHRRTTSRRTTSAVNVSRESGTSRIPLAHFKQATNGTGQLRHLLRHLGQGRRHLGVALLQGCHHLGVAFLETSLGTILNGLLDSLLVPHHRTLEIRQSHGRSKHIQ